MSKRALTGYTHAPIEQNEIPKCEIKTQNAPLQQNTLIHIKQGNQ